MTDANDIHRDRGEDGLRDAFDKARRKSRGNSANGGVGNHPAGGLGEDSPPPPEVTFAPTLWTWKKPEDVSARDWLYAKHYIRKFVGCTIGRRGHGKTTRAIAEILSMITGRDLLKTGQMPPYKLSVWYIGEDPRDEIERRFVAACDHYGITADEIDGRLFFDSVLDLKRGSAKVVRLSRGAVVANEDAIASFKAGIEDRKIDVLFLDPLKKFHGVTENSNDQMDEVIEVLAEIAMAQNISIEVLHHTRKPSAGNSGTPQTVDDARGADAIIAAARSARVITVMTAGEAPLVGIEEKDAWRYNRIDDGKSNMKPPGEALWAQIASNVLPCGENVGVLQPWEKPKPFANVLLGDLPAVQRAVQGGAFRTNCQSPQWLGWWMAENLPHLNVRSRYDTKPYNKAEIANLNQIIGTWRENGCLAIDARQDATRQKRPVFIVPEAINGVDDALFH